MIGSLKTYIPNRFVSLLVAASIAVTGLSAAAPAQAGDRDVARALAAIAGIAIIGAAVSDSQKDRRRHVYVAPRGAKAHRAQRHHKRVHRQVRRERARDHRHIRRAHRQHGYSARPRHK